MRIAISGCGIAGSAVAALLARQGHDVTVFEQAEVCRPVGAGIMLQPSGQAVLRQLRIAREVEARSAPLLGLDAWLANGRRLIQLRYHSLCGAQSDDAKSDAPRAWGVHRGTLFEKLYQCCLDSGVEICNSAKLIGYERRNDGVVVKDDVGRDYDRFDFVIASDGSRSQLREASSLPCKQNVYRYAALWTTGVCGEVEDRLHQVIDGTRRLVGLLPIGDGRCSFFWGIRADGYDALQSSSLQAWRAEVTELCPQARGIVDSVASWDELTFGTYRHVRMKQWFDESTLWLGDAAHAMSPHLGQGANLALEDAFVFAESLQSTGEFLAACDQFRQRRRRKIRYYQQLTRMLSPFFQSDVPFLALGRDLALPWFPRIPPIRRRMLTTLCGLNSGWFG